MSDEGFHEIQLNGKQLVFLFMSATVVAVVIFLCGVMVGRGVPTGAASAIGAPSQATLDPTAAVQGASAVRAVAINGNGPATAQETLTYTTLLDDPDPPAETLAPPVESTADVPVRVVASRPAPELPKRVAAAPLPLPVAPKPVAVAPPVPVAPKLAAVASKSVA
ncbi:MAG: hypothetical protein EXQ53_08860, partial [Acidobacteria bacterium]|nr:hypothetical protein [Acidobacteriota bacterium]